MSKTRKPLFNDLSLMANISEVFVDIMGREEVNPRHPAMPTVPRYTVGLFEHPECAEGEGYIVVKPQGSTTGRMTDLCTREVPYSLRINVIQDTQDQQGFDDFMQAVSKIQSLFRGGSNIRFEQGDISATLPSGTNTVSAPFNIYDLGIKKTELVSTTSPQRVKSGACSPWMTSMLVRLTLQFYAG